MNLPPAPISLVKFDSEQLQAFSGSKEMPKVCNNIGLFKYYPELKPLISQILLRIRTEAIAVFS